MKFKNFLFGAFFALPLSVFAGDYVSEGTVINSIESTKMIDSEDEISKKTRSEVFLYEKNIHRLSLR